MRLMYDSDVNFYAEVVTWVRYVSNHESWCVGLCIIMGGNFYLSCVGVKKIYWMQLFHTFNF